MQVLLVKNVDQLGQAGEIKKVEDGYARNYLIPRGLAVLATPGAIRQAELRKKTQAHQQARALTEAQALAQLLDGMTLTFQARAGEGGRLYGSVTNAHIADALQKQIGRKVDRRKIELEEPLKQLGIHAVTIRLAPQAEAKITVIVEREE